jgi:hypothetical protein
VISFVFSSHRSIYERQRVTVRKDGIDHGDPASMLAGVRLDPWRALRNRRRWRRPGTEPGSRGG